MSITAYEGECKACERSVFRWVRSTNTRGYYVSCVECGTPRWATKKSDTAQDQSGGGQ